MRETLKAIIDAAEARAAQRKPYKRKSTAQRRKFQHAQLIADGRKALALLQTRPVADVLLVIGGSRARLYRALEAAQRAEPIDPLLE